MLSKEEVLTILREGLRVEEDVIPIYSEHIRNSLFLSGLSAAETDPVKSILDKLKVDSERHRKIFQTLIARAEESNRDVY